MKHKLHIKYYLRYCDDFLLLHQDRKFLLYCTGTLKQFLRESLKLELHPKKVILKRLDWGVDFLGYIVLPHYTITRTRTKKRIFRKVLKKQSSNQTLQSYLGYLCHSNSYKISEELKNIFYLSK